MLTRPNATSVEMLDQLVGFDTTSRNSNLSLIAAVRSHLDAYSVPYRISLDPTGLKANLHAIIGPMIAGGVALSGHVDTVPVDGQSWSTDPFHLTSRDGRVFGRGTSDMKGFVACCLAAVPDLVAAQLSRPVHLFISYDEETNCAGARRLIQDLAESGLAPALCIVGEPSGMQPILAHKGRIALRITARGRAGHSSEPAHGVNAIYAAARAITWVEEDAARLASNGPFSPGFDPPYTTAHVGTVEGGTVLNMIPEQASFTMEWRAVPSDHMQAHADRLRAHVAAHVEPAMRAIDPACGVEIKILDTLPGMQLSPEHELASLVRQLTGSNSTGAVSYGTEGGLYQEAGMPTIVCGPGHIEQAHQPDEWIAVSELDACDAFIRRLSARLAA